MGAVILDTAPSVLQYLQKHDFSASRYDFSEPQEIQEIKGGTTNFTYRLIFDVSQREHDSSSAHSSSRIISSAILKFAAEYATNDPTTPFSSQRQLYEVRAMQSLAPATSLHDTEKRSIVKTPELYHFDENAHVIIMEDVSPPVKPGDALTYVSLDKMCQTPFGDNALDIIHQAGSELGQFLIRLHRHTENSSDPLSNTLRKLFLENQASKEIDIQTCFRDIPQKLEEFAIEVEPAEMAQLNKIIKDMVADYLETPQSIIMGDLWYGNIILKLSGENGQKILEQITLIDWEFATCAPSYVDLAHFLSEIWLQDRFFPGPSSAALVNREVAIATFKSYISLGGHIDYRRLTCYVGGHICCFLQFMDWNDDDGVKKTVAKEGVTMMLRAEAGQWSDLFKTDSFMETIIGLGTANGL